MHFIRDRETTIKIKFALLRVGALGREDLRPKTLFFVGNATKINFESANSIVEKFCCHCAGSYSSLSHRAQIAKTFQCTKSGVSANSRKSTKKCGKPRFLFRTLMCKECGLVRFWGLFLELPRLPKTLHTYKIPGEFIFSSSHKYNVIHTASRNYTWKTGILCVIHGVGHYIDKCWGHILYGLIT